MANIIDGKAISAQVKEQVKEEVHQLQAKGVQPAWRWSSWEMIPPPGST